MWDVIKRSQDFHCDIICAQSWGRSRNLWLKGLKIILTQPKHTPFCSILGYTKSNRWLTSNMCSWCWKNFSVRQVHVVIKTDGNGEGVPLDPPIFILWVLTPCDTIFTFSLVVNINNFHFGLTKMNQYEFLNCQYNIVNQEPVVKASLTIWPFLSLQLSILQFQVRDVTLSCHILPQHYLKTW